MKLSAFTTQELSDECSARSSEGGKETVHQMLLLDHSQRPHSRGSRDDPNTVGRLEELPGCEGVGYGLRTVETDEPLVDVARVMGHRQLEGAVIRREGPRVGAHPGPLQGLGDGIDRYGLRI